MKTLYICSTREQAERICIDNLLITNNDWDVRPERNVAYYGNKNISDIYWLFDKVVHVNYVSKEMPQQDISQRIHDWAADKGILEKATPLNQWDKTLEEVMELKEALIAQANGLEFFINSKGKKVNTYNAILDALGDVRVTIDIQCKMQKTSLDYCSELAYNVISKRTGKMINGQFVKDE